VRGGIAICDKFLVDEMRIEFKFLFPERWARLDEFGVHE
jgi:hypothetical protein